MITMTDASAASSASAAVGPIDVSFEAVLERSPAAGGWT